VLKALHRIRPEILHGAVTAGLLLAFALLISGAGNPLQRWLTDMVQRSTAVTDETTVVVAIDESSQAKLGDWPWSPEMQANLLERLRIAGVLAIGFATPTGDFTSDESRKLEQAILAQGHVVLPLPVSIKTDAGLQSRSLQTLLTRPQRHFADDSLNNALTVHALTNDSNPLMNAAAGLAHLHTPADSDGVTRRDYAAVKLDNYALPSMAVALANLTTGTQPTMIVTQQSLQLNTNSPITFLRNDLSYTPRLGREVPSVSAWDVLNGTVGVGELRNRIAVIGVTDGVSADRVLTATGTLPRAQLVAQQTRSLLLGNSFHHPGWAYAVEWLFAALIIGLSATAFLRISPSLALVIGLLLILAMATFNWYLLSHRSVNVYITANSLTLLCSIGFNFLMRSQRHPTIANSRIGNGNGISMETLKTLALTLHGQGQLDLAYETLRRCETNTDTLDLLYRLANDYERRRDILKAAQIHRYILEQNSQFKDCQAQLSRLQQLIERPKATQSGNPAPIRSINKPKADDDAPRKARDSLGRYEIEKQIGKGAMGVVYLGRDPKINRVVAIKAIPLAEEFEDHDLAEARERFFREAEMAGRLNHPGIVTIFDAGEDRGLAYIAMEFIQGEHLSYYCEPSRLLPARKAMTLVIRVAEALHYAHLQNVVHRDIKPANIMFNIDTDALKITDFGIARLADVSRTKTGIVLGTPSFMSPEQLEGRPLDGRSDLFSLGVSMYQLLTGQLPFRADSMTRLMNNIATEPHPPIRSIRPELPETLEKVLDRALAKSADDRFQTGIEMADAIRNCMRGMALKE
jgi:eukaryotic-like serine/threonine-protein kinase